MEVRKIVLTTEEIVTEMGSGCLVMPAEEPHAVKAVKGFKTLLPMIRSSWR